MSDERMVTENLSWPQGRRLKLGRGYVGNIQWEPWKGHFLIIPHRLFA